jgi:hypothetical protein
VKPKVQEEDDEKRDADRKAGEGAVQKNKKDVPDKKVENDVKDEKPKPRLTKEP